MFETIKLFRPVGQRELDLIAENEYRLSPPRLAEQPVFYPVLNEDYAAQIARDWNAKYNEDRVEYVTSFEVRKEFLDKYEKRTVGTAIHEEYWIPAEDLDEFNNNIVGYIEIVSRFDGV